MRPFWSQSYTFLQQALHLDKFEGVECKYDKEFLEFQRGNTQIKHFCPKYKYFSFLHKTSHIEKFEGTDIENYYSFFQISAKNIRQLNFTIITGKDWCFTQFSTRMAGQLLLIFFICLHNQLSFINSMISTDV